MIHIAICDDNLNELSHMIQLINQYITTRHLNCEYTVFQNGFELMALLERGKRFDLYCLDIIMPAFSGIAVAKKIRSFDKNAPILFFTSSTDYALESYSVKAINYVLKPVTKEKLFITFDEVLEGMKMAQEPAIVVKSNDGIQKILLSNLVYVEVIGRSVLYHLLSGKVIECIEPFSSSCDNLLKYDCFIRTHRSFIVNMQYVDTFSNLQITLQTGISIPIAQGRSREIKKKYLAFQMEEE